MEPKTTLNQEQLRILDFVIAEILKKGIKAMTMDSIAAGLQISKRTLYQIYSSKEEMVESALKLMHERNNEIFRDIFRSSSNTMEGILGCLRYNRDIISNASVDFFRDFDELVSKSKTSFKENKKLHYDNLVELLKKGVSEGYFRDDINLPIQCRMITIQMESLKRMEELFPPDITLLEVCDSITLSFLRGISTTKGNEAIDKFLSQINNIN